MLSLIGYLIIAIAFSIMMHFRFYIHMQKELGDNIAHSWFWFALANMIGMPLFMWPAILMHNRYLKELIKVYDAGS